MSFLAWGGLLFVKTSKECNYEKQKKKDKRKKKKEKKERGICVIKAQNKPNKSAGKILQVSDLSPGCPHFQIYDFRKGFRNPSLSLFSHTDIFSFRLNFPIWKLSERVQMNGEGRRRDRRDPRSSKKQKLIRSAEEELESKFGFDLFSEGDKRLGWLLTSSPVSQFWSLFINLISMYILLIHFWMIMFLSASIWLISLAISPLLSVRDNEIANLVAWNYVCVGMKMKFDNSFWSSKYLVAKRVIGLVTLVVLCSYLREWQCLTIWYSICSTICLNFTSDTQVHELLSWGKLLMCSRVLQSSWEDEDTQHVYSCVDLYFVSQVNFPAAVVFFTCMDSGSLLHLVEMCFSCVVVVWLVWLYNSFSLIVGWFDFQVKIQVPTLFLCSHEGMYILLEILNMGQKLS